MRTNCRLHLFPGLAILLLFFFLSSKAEDPSRVVLKKMLNACTSLRSGSMIFRSTERMDDGKYYDSEMRIKFETNPKKVYLYCIDPNAGAECLWQEGVNQDKVTVNPNGFPFFTLKLSPYNSLLRQDTHHTIKEVGFDYVLSMLKHYTEAYGDKFYNYLSVVDTLNWDGKKCIHIRFDYKPFTCVKRVVGHGESITSVSEKLYLSDYMVLRCNPRLKDYDSCKPGDVIQVPTFYNRKIEFYVDMQTWLPLVHLIYDDKGLFERYEMKSFVANRAFDPAEFTTKYKDYHF